MLNARRHVMLFAALFALTAAHAAPAGAQDDEAPLIGITSIAFSADIQAIIDGLRDRLAERGYVPGKSVTIQVRDAGADGNKAQQVVREFADERARVIVAITAPSIEAAVENAGRTPVVGAGLAVSHATELSNRYRRHALTGVAAGDTRDDQFALIRQVAPEVDTVAIPADPANGDLHTQIKPLVAAARNSNFSVRPLPVSVSRNAVGGALGELDPGKSVLLLDTEILPNAPVEALANAALGQKLRMFATDEESVIRGAIAAMVVEPFGVGQQVGDVVADILESPAAARQPFQRARASHLVLNDDGRALIDVSGIESELAENEQSVIDWAEDFGPRPRAKPAIPEPPPPLGVVRGIKVPTPRSRPQPPPL